MHLIRIFAPLLAVALLTGCSAKASASKTPEVPADPPATSAEAKRGEAGLYIVSGDSVIVFGTLRAAAGQVMVVDDGVPVAALVDVDGDATDIVPKAETMLGTYVKVEGTELPHGPRVRVPVVDPTSVEAFTQP